MAVKQYKANYHSQIIGFITCIKGKYKRRKWVFGTWYSVILLPAPTKYYGFSVFSSTYFRCSHGYRRCWPGHKASHGNPALRTVKQKNENSMKTVPPPRHSLLLPKNHGIIIENRPSAKTFCTKVKKNYGIVIGNRPSAKTLCTKVKKKLWNYYWKPSLSQDVLCQCIHVLFHLKFRLASSNRVTPMLRGM